MTDAVKSFGLSRNYIHTYKTLLYFGLTLLLASELLNFGGSIPLFVFVAYGLFFVILTKKMCDFLYWIVAILPNMSFLEGAFGFVSIRRVILAVGIIIFLLINKKTEGKLVPGWYYIGWFGYTSFNILIISDRGLSSILVLGVFFLIPYVTEMTTHKNVENSEKLIVALVTGMIYVMIVGYLELILGRTFFMSLWTGAERYRYGIIRVGSTVADSNNICFMVFPLVFLFKINIFDKWYSKRIAKVIMFFSTVLIVLTMSRTGIIALVICYLCSLMLKRKLYLTLTIPIIGSCVNSVFLYITSFLGQEQFQASNSYRKAVLTQAMIMWNKNKLFGIGSLSFLYELERTDSLNVMNTYAYCLVNYGIIGFLFYIVYWGLIIHRDIYAWVHNKILDKKSLIKITIIIGLLIISYTLDTFNFGLIWLIGALYMSIDYVSEHG